MRQKKHRVQLLELEKAENVFDVQPPPLALLVDLEGTITEFCPSPISVIEALAYFDEFATRKGLELRQLHYVTNADLELSQLHIPRIMNRFHPSAHKPFFRPPPEAVVNRSRTIVVGDQYLTDGLLAWRFGFSFGLVRASWNQPKWPRCQLFFGRSLSFLFFKLAK